MRNVCMYIEIGTSLREKILKIVDYEQTKKTLKKIMQIKIIAT